MLFKQLEMIYESMDETETLVNDDRYRKLFHQGGFIEVMASAETLGWIALVDKTEKDRDPDIAYVRRSAVDKKYMIEMLVAKLFWGYAVGYGTIEPLDEAPETPEDVRNFERSVSDVMQSVADKFESQADYKWIEALLFDLYGNSKDHYIERLAERAEAIDGFHPGPAEFGRAHLMYSARESIRLSYFMGVRLGMTMKDLETIGEMFNE